MTPPILDSPGGAENKALERFISLHYSSILRFCIQIVRDKYIAEDACQETFIRYCTHYGNCVDEKGHKSLLYRIARNVCIDIFRKKLPIPIDPYQVPDVFDEEEGFRQVESGSEFKDAFRQLSERSREALVLRYSHDLTLQQMASIWGVPMRTAQTRLRTAEKQLKRILKEAGES